MSHAGGERDRDRGTASPLHSTTSREQCTQPSSAKVPTARIELAATWLLRVPAARQRVVRGSVRKTFVKAKRSTTELRRYLDRNCRGFRDFHTYTVSREPPAHRGYPEAAKDRPPTATDHLLPQLATVFLITRRAGSGSATAAAARTPDFERGAFAPLHRDGYGAASCCARLTHSTGGGRQTAARRPQAQRRP